MSGLGLLWAVKSLPAPVPLAFPFFVVAMVPLRLALEYLPNLKFCNLKFTPQELEAVSIKFLIDLNVI